jgi:hypothetical protein
MARKLVNSRNNLVLVCVANNRDLRMEKARLEDVEPADHAWENHKRLITTLYTSWSLKEVQQHLEQHHGFRASYVRLAAQGFLRLISRLGRICSSESYKNGAL